MEFRVRNSKEEAVRIMCSPKLRELWCDPRVAKPRSSTLTPPFEELAQKAEAAICEIRSIISQLDSAADEWLTWLATYGPTSPEYLCADVITAALQPELEAYAELMAGRATRLQLAGWLYDQPIAVRMLDAAIVATCAGFDALEYEKRARAFLHVVFDQLCDNVHDFFICEAEEISRTMRAYTPRRDGDTSRGNYGHDRAVCDCFECDNERRAEQTHEGA